ncbi:hypothetical protein KDW54_22110 [Burkholderia ambifaria]|nr:hypothetical protein [Burkholderia ambifaria]MBR8185091.1 hypothetical protein [Burkholderia ambifaria]
MSTPTDQEMATVRTTEIACMNDDGEATRIGRDRPIDYRVDDELPGQSSP